MYNYIANSYTQNMTIQTTIKRWGNSMGVIIPAEALKDNGLKEGQEVIISIEKRGSGLRELFGALKFKKNTEQLLKEVRNDFESKWMK